MTQYKIAPGGNLFTNWLSLPREDDIATFSLQCCIALNVFWWFMFFIVGKYHYIPKRWKSKMSPYDLIVMGHRIAAMYNGAVAFSIGLYWYIFDNDRSCSKRNTTLEIVVACNLGAHFIWDCITMKWHGFLDGGNLMHHVFGVIAYYTILYHQFNMNVMMLHLLPAESTNVSMHLREVLKRLGYRYTWLFYANEYFYCTVYMICRTFWIPSVYYYIFPCESANPAVFIIYPLHCI